MKKRVGLTLVLLLAFALSTNPALAGGTVNYTANVQKVVLDNGLTLLLKENPAFDIIALALLSEVGTIYDPQGFEGLTYLTQRNLVSGTENRQALELITELESLGVTLNTLATNDISAVVLQALPDSFAASFEIVLDIIENSVFPEEEFARERELSLTELMSLTDDPVNALVLAYQEVFYGDHPYRYTAYGSYEGLLAVQREHLKEWKDYIYEPEHVTVAVVGNFDTAELLPILEEGFGSWQGGYSGSLPPNKAGLFSYPSEDRELVINLPTEAAFLMIGYPAPDTFDEDSAAMSVINIVLGGGGVGGRLFMEIRQKLGLAYTAFSAYDERLGPSNLLTFVATHPDNVEQVREKVLSEVQRFATEGLTEEEIAGVATQLRGQYLLNNETNMAQAVMLAQAELMGRGYQWVDEYMTFFDNVTPEDIKEAASKYFQHYTSVLVTP